MVKHGTFADMVIWELKFSIWEYLELQTSNFKHDHYKNPF